MKCLTCKKPIQWQDNPFRPFCSERCRMIDFGHWVDEDYGVPTEDAADFINDNHDTGDEDTSGNNRPLAPHAFE